MVQHIVRTLAALALILTAISCGGGSDSSAAATFTVVGAGS